MDEQRYKRKVLTPEQAHVKIRHYCAFQERTHQEVKQKLSGYGLSWSVANELLSKLIEEGFLNEERFAGSGKLPQSLRRGVYRITVSVRPSEKKYPRRHTRRVQARSCQKNGHL
jgi:SOS response regulatory protein OraA/RecX